ncbi:hypothetical protein ACFPJ4_04900 [Lysinimonas soli]|uniref:Uncharacterized protein n=1 Tax=Lysinimonas soli TaxID=1074233 RepID=A0ABW0NQM7_9MICO
MPRISALATAFAAVLLLSSCAPSAAAPNTPSASPDPSASPPPFLAAAQLGTDRLPDGIATRLDLDDDSSRLQGSWDERDVFLALKGTSTVCLVTGIPAEPGSWVTGCGDGDEIVTSQLPDGAVVKYLPMTTATTPQGWTKLSDFVYAM